MPSRSNQIVNCHKCSLSHVCMYVCYLAGATPAPKIIMCTPTSSSKRAFPQILDLFPSIGCVYMAQSSSKIIRGSSSSGKRSCGSILIEFLLVSGNKANGWFRTPGISLNRVFPTQSTVPSDQWTFITYVADVDVGVKVYFNTIKEQLVYLRYEFFIVNVHHYWIGVKKLFF